MDFELEKRRANRFRVLKAVYDATAADPRRWADARQLTAHDERLAEGFRPAYQWLKDERLIKQYGAGFTCQIAHEGIRAIEDALLEPDGPTRFFPPADSIEAGGAVPRL